MARCVTVYQFIGCSWWSAQVLRDLPRTWLEHWWAKTFGEEYMSKGCEDICVLCKCLPKGDLSRRGFKNQVDRMTCSVDSSQPLLSATPSLPCGLLSEGTMVAGMEIMPGHSSIDFYSPRVTWLQPLLNFWSDRSNDQHWVPNMTSFPRAIIHPTTSQQVNYSGPLPLWKGLCFVLNGINTYPGYPIAFPAHNTKTVIHRFIECLIHHCGIPHSIAFDQETSYFIAKEVWQWAHTYGIIGFTMFPAI